MNSVALAPPIRSLLLGELVTWSRPMATKHCGVAAGCDESSAAAAARCSALLPVGTATNEGKVKESYSIQSVGILYSERRNTLFRA